jgi:hypothetical protein
MDHELRRALRAAADDPLAMAAVGTALTRAGRIDPVQGDWLREVAARIETLRWPPGRVAWSIRSCLGTEALAAALVSVARVACEGAEVPFKAAGRTLSLCQRALLHGLTADEQLEIERLRSTLVEYTSEYITPRMLAALWCLVRTTQAVERARTPWVWSRVSGVLRCARAALPGRGQANRLRGALVRGVLDLQAALDLRFPPWGTLWIEERPLLGVGKAKCAHAAEGQTASYRLILEANGQWRAITPTLRRCCLAAGQAPRRESAIEAAGVSLQRFVDRGLHAARAHVVEEEVKRLLRGASSSELPMAMIPEGPLGTWSTPAEVGCVAPLRLARRHPRPRAASASVEVGDPHDEIPF